MESTPISTTTDERVDGQEQNVRHCPICPEISLALDTYCQHLLEHVNELTAQPLTTDVAICRDLGPSTSHREDSPEQAVRSCQPIDVGEIYQNVLLGQVILNWAQQFVTTRENQQSVVDRLIAPGSPIKSVRPDEKQFACNRCPFRAKSIQHLNSHENCHRDNKILFSCDICGAQFSQKSNLKRHSVGHQAGPTLTCVLCPRRFHRRDQMMEHVLSHWSDYRVIIRCPVVDCQESMDSRRDLKVHMRREHPGGEMHCSHCDKSYPGDKLVRHSLNVYATLFTAVIKRDPTTDPIHLDCTAPRTVIGINCQPPEINGDEKAASVDHNHNDQENMDGKEI